MTCPECKSTALKVIYLGFPMRLCADERCSTLWGMWSFVPDAMPLTPDGYWAFYGYNGHYLPALYRWLKGD